MATATLSIDWEDFSQHCSKYRYGKFTEPVNAAIERQTNIILDLLDETERKATFFVVGKLAEYRPQLVKLIAARGHEIALHGQNHVAMFSLSPAEAKEEVTTAFKAVTDITGAEIFGFRAPFFSLKKENIYLLEILADLGLLYDSSIFPTALPRYGIANFDRKDALYDLPNGMQIVELPMTTGRFMNKDWPVSGGGYIRLMPSFMIRKIFKKISSAGNDSMIYMHPYEFDTQPIDVSANYPQDAAYSRAGVAAMNFRWNLFRPSVTGKIKMLLKEHSFITCVEKALAVKNNNAPAALNIT